MYNYIKLKFFLLLLNLIDLKIMLSIKIKPYITFFWRFFINVFLLGLYNLTFLPLNELHLYPVNIKLILLIINFNGLLFGVLYLLLHSKDVYILLNSSTILINTLYKIFLYIFSIIFVYSFYVQLTIVQFLLLIFFIVLFIQFINYIRTKKLSNKVLNLLANKNYKKWFERIILIKIILFFGFIFNDQLFFCDNFWTRVAHDTFVQLGSHVGIQPKTTVSNLETMGMIFAVGSICYGTIKAYQYFILPPKPSVEDKLNILFLKMDEMETRITNQIENSSLNSFETVNLVHEKVLELGLLVTKVQSDLVDVDNHLLNFVGQSMDKHNTLYELILQNNKETTDLLQDQINNNFMLINQKLDQYIQKMNEIDLDPDVKFNLQSLHAEMQTLLLDQSNLVSSTISTSNDVSRTITSLTQPNLLPERLKKISNNKEIKQYLESYKKQMEDLKPNPSSSSLSIPRIQSVPESKQSNNLLLLYKRTENANGAIIFEKYYPSSELSPTTDLSRIASRAFNNLPLEFMLKVISAAIQNSVSGLITVSALNTVVNSFRSLLGFGTSSISTSERIGEATIKNIKDFIRGIRNEL
jgi:hypothetical protein